MNPITSGGNMRKLTCTLLVALMLVSSCLLFSGGARASTQVSGIIASDTTWTQANSPYSLAGTVTVPSNVTLTIEPGVTVNFGSYYIQVNGTLNARGTSGSAIYFSSNASYNYNQRIEFLSGSTSWNDQNGTGSIIENAVFNNVTITISSSPKVSSNSFNNQYAYAAVNLNSGSSQILSNSINSQNMGVSVSSGSPTISYNTITANGSGIVVNAGKALVSYNTINSCWTGINVQGNPTIQGNTIINNNYGIMTYGSPTISNNAIAGNVYGIDGNIAGIQYNTIEYNTIGVYEQGSSGVFTHNNILNNYQLNIMMSNPSNLYATGNWWGTTDNQAINHMILDSKNFSYLGTVSFVPLLTQPEPSAPSVPNVNLNHPSNVDLGYILPLTPTPTATPAPPTDAPATAEPTPTPVPTPSPTPIIMPGSALSLGDSSFAEVIAQLDIFNVAEMVLVILGVVWVIVILVSVDRNFGRKEKEKQ